MAITSWQTGGITPLEGGGAWVCVTNLIVNGLTMFASMLVSFLEFQWMRMLHYKVNAIPLPCEQPILELEAHQQNLSNMEGNLEDAALVDHVMEVVQQARDHGGEVQA